jgi:hypothetical protein
MATSDAYTFNTTDVHPRDQPKLENHSIFSMSANPVGFPIGLTWLDINRCLDICINASAEPVTSCLVKIHFDASVDTVLYSAGCMWFTVYDQDIQFGEFNTTDDHPCDKLQMQTKSIKSFSFLKLGRRNDKVDTSETHDQKVSTLLMQA